MKAARKSSVMRQETWRERNIECDHPQNQKSERTVSHMFPTEAGVLTALLAELLEITIDEDNKLARTTPGRWEDARKYQWTIAL